MARQGKAVVARRGKARQGKAVEAWQGKARQAIFRRERWVFINGVVVLGFRLMPRR